METSDSEDGFLAGLPAVGSAVCIKNREAAKKLDINTCHVGKILDYFSLGNQSMVSVEHYLRPNVLPSDANKQGYELDEKLDVIIDYRKCISSFEVDDIIIGCQIIPGFLSECVDATIETFKSHNLSDKPVFVCRFKLIEREGSQSVLRPLRSSVKETMAPNKEDVLCRNNLIVKGEVIEPLKPKNSPQPMLNKKSADDISKACADSKENMSDNMSPPKESCQSSGQARSSRASVRRSLEHALEGPPIKQYCKGYEDDSSSDSQRSRRSIRCATKSSNTEGNKESSYKDAWVSKLLDIDKPVVEGDGRCVTPIKMSLKRLKQDETPSKKDGSGLSDLQYNSSQYSERSAMQRAQNNKADGADADDEEGSEQASCSVHKSDRPPKSPKTPRVETAVKEAHNASSTCKRGRTPKTPIRRKEEDTGECEQAEQVFKKSPRSVRSSRVSVELSVRTPRPRRSCAESVNYKEGLMSPNESDSSFALRAPSTSRPRRSCAESVNYKESLMSPNESDTPVALRTPITTSRSRRSCAKDPSYQDDVSSSDESGIENAKKTPNRRKTAECHKTPKKTNETPLKTSVTPKTIRSNKPSRTSVKGCLTPSMPARATAPLAPLSSLEQVRKNLHVSAIPMSLPCRESEFRNIYNFLENKIKDAAGGCMYISGVPGTGKTATVHAVIRSLKEEVENRKLRDFQYIEVNGLRMTEPRQVFVQVLKGLTGQKHTPQQAQDILAERFCSGKNKTTVLLVDEVDMLRNRRQDVIYNLFDWPSKPNSHFIVLTIANTMDLPERLLKGRVTSRLGLTRLTFQPYSYKQLQEIVISRLQGSNTFKDDAVELVARKVAACSGDVRRALDICRRASELIEEGSCVTMSIVNQVLSKMMNSANVCSIKACSKLEKLFLQAVVAENERTGVEETMFISVYRQFKSLCALDNVALVNISQAMAMLGRLGTSGLLLTQHSRADINQSIFLNVNADDVHYACLNGLPSS